MRPPTHVSLSLFVGLLASALAACSGGGQDGLVTVGIRPTEGIAATSGSPVVDAGVVPAPEIDAMNQAPDATSTTPRSVAPADAFVRAGSGAAGTRAVATAFPVAAMAGAGGDMLAEAGAGGALALNEDVCGTIPAQPAGLVSSGWVNGSGLIEYDASTPNTFVRLRTTLEVPAQPAPSGQIFVWSGIQPAPSGASFQGIGNGALASVLAWGALCPADSPPSYSGWWFSPMYSNISSSDPKYSGCHAGRLAQAQPKQLVDVDIQREGTTWLQKVVNRDTMEASDFKMDLKGQDQGRTIFALDLQTSNKPTEDVVFTNTIVSMDMPDPTACEPVMRGTNDFASRPRVSADGRHCCIDRIVLRASRVTPTTVDPP